MRFFLHMAVPTGRFSRKLDDLSDPDATIGRDHSPVGIAYIAPFAVRAIELDGDAH